MLSTRRRCFAVLSLFTCFFPSSHGAGFCSALRTRHRPDRRWGSGATVTAKDTDMGISRVTVTDAAGRYELPALPLGRYEVDGDEERICGSHSRQESYWS